MNRSISNNNVTGDLPDSWSTLPELTELKLSHNELNGTLPDSWGSLAKTEVLYVQTVSFFKGCFSNLYFK